MTEAALRLRVYLEKMLIPHFPFFTSFVLVWLFGSCIRTLNFIFSFLRCQCCTKIESEWNHPEPGILAFKIFSATVMKKEHSNCYFSTPTFKKNLLTCVDVLKNNTNTYKFIFKRTKLLNCLCIMTIISRNEKSRSVKASRLPYNAYL